MCSVYVSLRVHSFHCKLVACIVSFDDLVLERVDLFEIHHLLLLVFEREPLLLERPPLLPPPGSSDDNTNKFIQ